MIWHNIIWAMWTSLRRISFVRQNNSLGPRPSPRKWLCLSFFEFTKRKNKKVTITIMSWARARIEACTKSASPCTFFTTQTPKAKNACDMKPLWFQAVAARSMTLLITRTNKKQWQQINVEVAAIWHRTSTNIIAHMNCKSRSTICTFYNTSIIKTLMLSIATLWCIYPCAM